MGGAFTITTTINPSKPAKKRKTAAKKTTKARKASTKAKAPAKSKKSTKAKKTTKAKRKPGRPRRASTGEHDWQIVFFRDGAQIATRGPYVTKRAALADAKVVVRARIGPELSLVKETDVYGKETGYGAEDGSFRADVVASTGEVTDTGSWRTYNNPRRRNPATVTIGGKTKAVKNLGWLLRNWQDVSAFTLHRRAGGAALLVAHLRHGGNFTSDFASFSVAQGFLDRPVFRGVPVEIR